MITNPGGLIDRYGAPRLLVPNTPGSPATAPWLRRRRVNAGYAQACGHDRVGRRAPGNWASTRVRDP